MSVSPATEPQMDDVGRRETRHMKRLLDQYVWMCVAGGISAAPITLSAFGIVNGAEVPCSDRRFDCVGQIFASANNCSGAAPATAAHIGACVLIAPNVVVFADHERTVYTDPSSGYPQLGQSVRFRRNSSGLSQDTLWISDSVSGADFCSGVYQEAIITQVVYADAENGYFLARDPVNALDLAFGLLDHCICNIRPAPMYVPAVIPQANGTAVYGVAGGMNFTLAGWGNNSRCIQPPLNPTLLQGYGSLQGDPSTYPLIVGSGIGECASGCFLTLPTTDESCSCQSNSQCPPHFDFSNCPGGQPITVASVGDSGGAVFVECANPYSADPLPELWLVGVMTSLNLFVPVAEWNALEPNNVGTPPPTLPTPCLSSEPPNRCGPTAGVPMVVRSSPMLTFGGLSDFNRDGLVTISDILAFLDAYFARVCIADVDQSGSVDVHDLFMFLGAWFGKR